MFSFISSPKKVHFRPHKDILISKTQLTYPPTFCHLTSSTHAYFTLFSQKPWPAGRAGWTGNLPFCLPHTIAPHPSPPKGSWVPYILKCVCRKIVAFPKDQRIQMTYFSLLTSLSFYTFIAAVAFSDSSSLQ